MKASELLQEIKEDMRNFNTKQMEENLKKEDINPISKQLSKFNLENYYEIFSKNIPEEEAVERLIEFIRKDRGQK